MPTTVHVRKEAFLIMLWASVEIFKKECLGVLLGDTPSPSRDYFLINDVIPFQGVEKRLNTQVVQSDRSNARWNEFWGRLQFHPERLGLFHSHPEWGSHKPPSEMSNKDASDMKAQKSPLEVIICISSRRKGRHQRWELMEDESIKGSLSIYNFRVNAFTLTGEGDAVEPVRIQIVSPAALRKLNRAQR